MNIEMVNGIATTSELPGQMNFLEQIAGASEHHARTSQLQGEEQDLMENAVVSFEKYFDSLKKRGKKIDLNGCSMKMLRECYQATEDLTTLPFSLQWMNWGTIANGKLLTQRISAPPQNRERVYTIGHLRTKGTAKVFPIEGTNGAGDICKVASISGMGHESNGRVYNPDGICPALVANSGGYKEPKTAIPISMEAYEVKEGELENAPTLNARDARGIHGMNNHCIGMFPPSVDATGKQIPVTFDKFEVGSEIDEALTLLARSQGNFSGIKGHPNTAIVLPCLTPDRGEKRQNGRRFKEDGEPSFTLTAQDRHGVALGILRQTRSEYGKEIRKEYESGALDISRHEFLEYDVRVDGISNTIDTVPKDNHLAVAVPNPEESDDKTIEVKIDIGNGESETVYGVWYEKYNCYIAIRRLTPRECFRLQGWSDEYFERAAFVNSDAQLYKQAGNGVTVNVVHAIAEKMNKAKEDPEA